VEALFHTKGPEAQNARSPSFFMSALW